MDASTDPGTLAKLNETFTRAKRKPPNRRSLAIIVAVAATLLIVGYGYRWWTVSRFIEGTDDAYVRGDVTAISPHISGFIAQIEVTDNQEVKAGQLLVRLDDRDVRAAADHAEAVLKQRIAMEEGLRARYALQQSVIDQASADLEAKTAQAEFARIDADRYRSLALNNDGSQQNAQRTRSIDQAARAAVTSAQANLTAGRQQLAVLSASLDEAAAAIAQARADLEAAKLNVGYAEIRSPIDGYVGNRAARTGAFVVPGSYLLTIVPSRGLWVDANFKEDQLTGMKPGQRATVVADVMPGRVFHGRLASLAPATGSVFSVIPPENATGNFTKIVQRVPVRILLDDNDAVLGGIRPGLSTYATVDTRQ